MTTPPTNEPTKLPPAEFGVTEYGGSCEYNPSGYARFREEAARSGDGATEQYDDRSQAAETLLNAPEAGVNVRE